MSEMHDWIFNNVANNMYTVVLNKLDDTIHSKKKKKTRQYSKKNWYVWVWWTTFTKSRWIINMKVDQTIKNK